jgi:hypothetical protein
LIFFTPEHEPVGQVIEGVAHTGPPDRTLVGNRPATLRTPATHRFVMNGDELSRIPLANSAIGGNHEIEFYSTSAQLTGRQVDSSLCLAVHGPGDRASNARDKLS